MNQLFVPLDSKLVPRNAGTPSIRDMLARELSDEWCGVESDAASEPESSQITPLPWGLCSPVHR